MRILLILILISSVTMAGSYIDASFGEIKINGRFIVKTVEISDDYIIKDDDVFIRFHSDSIEANAVIYLPDASECCGRILYFSNSNETHSHTGGIVFETKTPEQNALYPVQQVFNLKDVLIQENSFPYLDILMPWYDEIHFIFPFQNTAHSKVYWLQTISSDVKVDQAFTRYNSRNARADNFRLFPLLDKGIMLFWHHDLVISADTIGMINIQTLPQAQPIRYTRIANWSSLSVPRFSSMERSWGMYGAPDSIMIYTADSVGALWVTSIQTDSLIVTADTWNPYRQILTNVGRFSTTSQAWGTQFVAYQTFDEDSVYLYNFTNDSLVPVGETSVATWPVVVAECVDGAMRIAIIYQKDNSNTQIKVSRSSNGYPISETYSVSAPGLTQPFMDPGNPSSIWAMLSVFTAIDTTGTLKISFPCNADDITIGAIDRMVELPFDVYPDAPVIARRNLASEAVLAWYDSNGIGPYVGLVWFLDAGQNCSLISDGSQWLVLER